MNFFRQYISPILILIMFIIALVAVSSRAFLPSDLASPAPISEDVSVLARSPYNI